MEKRKALSIQEVTSTNRTLYNTLKDGIQNIVAGEKEKIEQQRFSLPVSYRDFCDLFIAFGTITAIHFYKIGHAPRENYQAVGSVIYSKTTAYR